jgi:hypothetical protein
MPDRVRNVSGYHWSCTWMTRRVEPVWLDSVPLTVTVEVVDFAHWGVTPVMETASECEAARSVRDDGC